MAECSITWRERILPLHLEVAFGLFCPLAAGNVRSCACFCLTPPLSSSGWRLGGTCWAPWKWVSELCLASARPARHPDCRLGGGGAVEMVLDGRRSPGWRPGVCVRLRGAAGGAVPMCGDGQAPWSPVPLLEFSAAAKQEQSWRGWERKARPCGDTLVHPRVGRFMEAAESQQPPESLGVRGRGLWPARASVSSFQALLAVEHGAP